jgi:hypothetical protein
MSYSYIKSVFPNFEDSNKVYDESLYSNLQTPLAQPAQPQLQIQEVPKDNVSLNAPINADGFQQMQPSYTFTDAVDRRQGSGSGDFASSTFEKSLIQNNLRFYNTPISESIKDIEYKNINPYRAYNDKNEQYGASLIAEMKPTALLEVNVNKKLEKFEEDDCDVYIKHIVDCRRCRDMISRQFNIYDNEEIMEIVSYLIFGLFILLVINSLKNNK